MNVDLTASGFQVIRAPGHPDGADLPLAQESASEDGFLWIGNHHLNYEQARELGERLIRWAGHGTLRMADECEPALKRDKASAYVAET